MPRGSGTLGVEDIPFIEVLMKGLRVMALGAMQDKYDIWGTHFFNYGQLKPGIAPHPSQSEGWWGGRS